MEVMHGLSRKKLDLIIFSPGGSAEVTEGLVSYLRTKYDDIRAVIPQSAMSAATMLACAANKIVMGKHSFLGPIDPQIITPTPLGMQMIPAQAIIDQFDLAREDWKDPKTMGRWIPILPQYGPGLLVQCQNAIDLSKTLLDEWLQKFMFAGNAEGAAKAKKIADYLGDHTKFKSHNRHVSREKAREIGLDVESLEDDQEFQDLVLSIFHAATHTLGGTPVVKIIENHKGSAYIKVAHQGAVLQIPSPPKQAEAPPA
jgi:hypothetical protein